MKSHQQVRPRRMQRRGQKRIHRVGFTLVEIMIVVLILAVLLSLATPSFVHARDEGRQKACVTNLKRIAGAKEEWALENRKGTGAAVLWSDLATYFRGPKPACPTDPANYAYTINPIGQQDVCTYYAPVSDPSLKHQYNF